MKRNIVIGLVILGIAAMLYLSYKGNTSTVKNNSFTVQSNVAQSNGIIQIVDNNKALGDIPMKNGKKEVLFTIKNTGTETVVLGKAATSCMCTNAYVLDAQGNKSTEISMRTNPFLNITIAPGETRQVLAIFDPNAHGPDATGPISRNVTIETNSKQTPGLSLNFFGDVVK